LKFDRFLTAVLVLTVSLLSLLIPLFFLVGIILVPMVPGIGGSGSSSGEFAKIGVWLLPGILLLLFGLHLADQRKVEAIIRSAIIIVVIQFLIFFIWRPMAGALG
jgi:hypothetical protein